MREKKKRLTKIVCNHDPQEFEKACNKVAEEIAHMEDVTKTTSGYTEEGKHFFVAEFDFTETIEEPEGIDEVFGANGAGCKCSDCPFLEIGADARRKYFPCSYAEFGSSHLDSPACDVFYKEAVKMMRERCKDANKEKA